MTAESIQRVPALPIPAEGLEARVRSHSDQTLIVALRDAPHSEVAVLREGDQRDYSDEDTIAQARAARFAASPELLVVAQQLIAEGVGSPELQRTARIAVMIAAGQPYPMAVALVDAGHA